MQVSELIDYTKALDLYGDLIPSMGFHSFLLEAGIRRAETKVTHRFLKLVCRSAMKQGNAHTILLESFGKPLLILQNLSYTFQPYKERKVYVVHVEEVYAKRPSPWNMFIVGGLCVGILASMRIIRSIGTV